MKKYNYYGLKNGQFLGVNPGRKENYFYKIFSDGSEAVIIKSFDNSRSYIFGPIEYCKKLYRQKKFNDNIFTLSFIKALEEKNA